MGTLVTYTLEGSIATIAMDDGKANAISPSMISDLNRAFDRAEADRAIVLFTGREGVFSAGFDLRVLRAAGMDAFAMIRGGFELAERILAYPRPVVVACNGHAIAMGAFLLLSGDYRIGVRGPFKLVTNEVAIGIPMPRAGVEISRQRLAPAHFNRAVLLAETYSPDEGLVAGFVDRLVDVTELHEAAKKHALELAKLDMAAHTATKLRARQEVLRSIRSAIRADSGELLVRGVGLAITGKLGRGSKPGGRRTSR